MKQPSLPRLSQAAAFEKVIVADNFSPDEAPFHVSVYLSGCLLGGGITADSPGLDLVGSSGKEGHESQKVMGKPDRTIKP
jgi:hypothetical protein